MSDTHDVFKLRKKGQYKKAVKLARKLYKKTPDDEWTIKAYGYSLISRIEVLRKQNNNSEFLDELQEELFNLEIDISDQPLIKSRDKALSSPRFNRDIEKAKKLSKNNDNHKAARKILINVLKEEPFNQKALFNLGWANYRLIKTESKPNKAKYLLEYPRLFSHMSHINNLLHWMTMSISTKIADKISKYPLFIKSCMIDNIIACPQNLKDSFTPPTFQEMIIKGMYRNLKIYDKNRRIVKNWFLPCLLKWEGQWNDSEWNPYYFGRLLCWLDSDKNKAQSHLIPVARRKSSEFWIWEALAEAQKTKDLKLACYCKSIRSNAGQEIMKKRAFLKLAKLLTDTNHKAEASKCADKYLKITSHSNTKVPNSIKQIQRKDWYSPQSISNQKFIYFLEEKSEKAEDLLIKDLKARPANYVKSNYSDKKSSYYHQFVLANGKEATLKSKNSLDLDKGAPVKIRSQSFNSNKIKVIWWKEREGEKWDLIEKQLCVVIHINPDNKYALVKISKDDKAIIRKNSADQINKLRVGDIIKGGIIETGKKKFEVASWEKTTDSKLPDFYRIFEGTFIQHEGNNFGFVRIENKEDVFVAPEKAESFQNHDIVYGIAIYSKKPKGGYGWESLNLNKRDYNE